MTAEMLVLTVVVGLVAGGLAGFVMKDGGYGLLGDMLLGLGGSMVGASLFRVLAFGPGAGRLAMVGVAFAGAVMLIFAQRTLWHTHA